MGGFLSSVRGPMARRAALELERKLAGRGIKAQFPMSRITNKDILRELAGRPLRALTGIIDRIGGISAQHPTAEEAVVLLCNRPNFSISPKHLDSNIFEIDSGPAIKGSRTAANIPQFAEKVMNFLNSYDQKKRLSFTLEEINTFLKRNGHPALDKKEFNAVKKLLILEKRIEIVPAGKIRRYNQVAHIQLVTSRLGNELCDINNLHQLSEIVSKECGGLFKHFRFYIKSIASSGGEEKKVMLMVVGKGETKYNDWAEIEEEGVFQMLFAKGGGCHHAKHIRELAIEKGHVSQEDFAKYDKDYNIGEVLYLAQRVNGEGMGAMIFNWGEKGSTEQNTVLYSKNLVSAEEIGAVNDNLIALLSTINSQIAKIRLSNPNKSLKQIWEEESEKGMIPNIPVSDKGKAEVPNGYDNIPLAWTGTKGLYDYALPKVELPSYLGFRLTSLQNPSKLDGSVQNAICKALDFMGRGFKDMLKHVINVDELVVAFDKDGTPLGFASASGLDFRYNEKNRQRNGTVYPLIGTAVRPEHQGKAFQVVLNSELLTHRWLGYRVEGRINLLIAILTRMFSEPLTITANTRNEAVIDKIYERFSNIRYGSDLTPVQRAARKRFAEHIGVEIPENGIIRGLYRNPLPAAKIERPMSAQAKAVLEGLGPDDARNLVFEAGWREFIKGHLWLLLKDMSGNSLSRFD